MTRRNVVYIRPQRRTNPIVSVFVALVYAGIVLPLVAVWLLFRFTALAFAWIVIRAGEERKLNQGQFVSKIRLVHRGRNFADRDDDDGSLDLPNRRRASVLQDRRRLSGWQPDGGTLLRPLRRKKRPRPGRRSTMTADV